MGDPSGIIVTKHARERARERCGLGGSSTLSLANRAYLRGILIDECPGSVKDYLLRKTTEDEHGDVVKVYGEIVFVFSGQKLVTVWNLPRPIRDLMRKFAVKFKKKRIKRLAKERRLAKKLEVSSVELSPDIHLTTDV